MKRVTDFVVITDADTDASIMEKVSERIGRRIVAVEWYGVSGSGVRGIMLLEVPNGGEPEKLPFMAYAKPGLGGAFEAGDWVVPYVDATYQDTNILIARLERKLSKDGTLRRRV